MTAIITRRPRMRRDCRSLQAMPELRLRPRFPCWAGKPAIWVAMVTWYAFAGLPHSFEDGMWPMVLMLGIIRAAFKLDLIDHEAVPPWRRWTCWR